MLNNMKKTKFERKSKSLKMGLMVLLCASVFAFALCGCDPKEGEEGENADTADTSQNSDSSSDYQDYIHDALAAVRDGATVTVGNGTEAVPDSGEDSGRIIYVEKADSPNDAEVFVSSSSAEDLVFPDPADETEGQKDADNPTDTNTKEPTPATFDVGKGLVYIDGEYDTTYSTNLQTIINDARTGLNYPAFTVNTSLGTCANLRAKEITCYLSHMRPDGSMFYSLAPQYYKGEIITIDGASEKETFDAWLEDPISRSMIFSEDYTNVGVSTYVCNGLNCTVVSFGY